MQITEIKTILEGIGLPVTYYSWPEDDPLHPVPQLPYIVWYLPGSENFGADDRVYQQIQTLNVELYTETKSFAWEIEVENVLDDNNLFWDKVETYINSEHMYQVLYTMEVIVNA